jgi:hypothetical protein
MLLGYLDRQYQIQFIYNAQSSRIQAEFKARPPSKAFDNQEDLPTYQGRQKDGDWLIILQTRSAVSVTRNAHSREDT